MGKTGLSCACYLHSCGESFVWCDTRDNPPDVDVLKKQFSNVQFVCGALDAELLCQASEIIVSPGVSVMEPALQAAAEKGIALVGDIELFARATQKPIPAITGSNAKSTVTTLVGDMAKACGLRAGVGGNLGTPVLEMLQRDAETDCYVLELSSFQLETTHSLHAVVATVLNISDDHMDRYDSVADYTRAKHRIYHQADNLVFNRADALTKPNDSLSATDWSFGVDTCGENAHAVGVQTINHERYLVCGNDKNLLPLSAIRLAGQHNVANVAAAFAIALAAGWDSQRCADAVRTFTGLPHRCQWVAEKNGVRYYNDSKGTNVGATIAAIEGLAQEKNIVLIAGGEGKGADFSVLAPVVARHVRVVILIGRDAGLIAEHCGGAEKIPATSMQDAVRQAAKHARKNDVVLLSPACASFDMFKNYEDRGQQFYAAVEALV
jgi:UDP-N-acetylmuramoylalanine--D-glutamate ligase